MVNLLDATTTLMSSLPYPGINILIIAILKGTPAPVIQTNVTIEICDNSTVELAAISSSSQPTETDVLAFINFPAVANHSTFVVHDVWRDVAVYGSPFAAIGDVVVEGCTMVVESVTGISMLLYVAMGPLRLTGVTQLRYDHVSATSLRYGVPMHAFTIGVVKSGSS
ncbi:Hypothetical protein, putative [Bodo saltans]|uniref:Uncharacterized protein n=1 Tax=Bodo saltans TaxID=75058 RepID=A0A0S4IN10_BODSA|nr:Hypothetical protein, putative [Bodo saltans]|eukprot:CUE69838.1 Hypothetical protein, putative [Bodo saltans]